MYAFFGTFYSISLIVNFHILSPCLGINSGQGLYYIQLSFSQRLAQFRVLIRGLSGAPSFLLTTPSILSQPHPRPQESSLENHGDFFRLSVSAQAASPGLLIPPCLAKPYHLREVVGPSGRYTGVEPAVDLGLSLRSAPY